MGCGKRAHRIRSTALMPFYIKGKSVPASSEFPELSQKKHFLDIRQSPDARSASHLLMKPERVAAISGAILVEDLEQATKVER